MFRSDNSTGCLLGQAFAVESEVLSTSPLEAFFIDCISSVRDSIASSMDA